MPWELADQEDLLCAQLRLQSARRYGLRLPRSRSPPRAVAAGASGSKRPFGTRRSPERRLLRRDREAEAFGRTQTDSFAGRFPNPSCHRTCSSFTRWIADRYLCAWGQVLETVVPAGVKNRAGTREVLMLRIDAEAYAALNGVELPAKQAAVMKVLAAAATPLPLELVARQAGCGTAPITALRQESG